MPAYAWTLMDASEGGFLSLVKQKATLPPNTRFTAEVLRRMADEEMRTRVVPALLEAGGENFGYTARVPVVAGRARVRLPPRLLRLRGLHLEVDGRPRALERADAEALAASSGTGTPTHYVLEGSGAVRLYPTPDRACTLVVRMFQHASAHVDPAGCGIISAFDATTRTLTLKSAPPAAFVPGARLDVLAGQPDFQWLGCDLTVQSVGPLTVTLTEALPEDTTVGDYLALAGETPVPQAPVPWHAVLVQAVTCECLRAQGDTEALAAAEVELAGDEARARSSAAPASHQPVPVYQGDFL